MGYGSILINKIVKLGKKNKKKKILLHVNIYNKQAIKFYKKNFFTHFLNKFIPIYFLIYWMKIKIIFGIFIYAFNNKFLYNYYKFYSMPNLNIYQSTLIIIILIIPL